MERSPVAVAQNAVVSENLGVLSLPLIFLPLLSDAEILSVVVPEPEVLNLVIVRV